MSRDIYDDWDEDATFEPPKKYNQTVKDNKINLGSWNVSYLQL